MNASSPILAYMNYHCYNERRECTLGMSYGYSQLFRTYSKLNEKSPNNHILCITLRFREIHKRSVRIPEYINIVLINLSEQFYVLLADVPIVFLVGGGLVLSLADSHRLVSYVGQELIRVNDGGFVL